MEFRILFPILKKHLSDGADIPVFFRELMAMMTDVSEEEWGTEKDPSTGMTKDGTLRGYVKRGLSKRFAQKIAYRLTPEYLVERIDEMPEAARQAFADDLSGYFADIDVGNISTTIAEWMTQIIQTAAGLISREKLEQQKQQEAARELKERYGDYLLNEAGGFCPFPGCGKSLTVAKDGKTTDCYEVSLIDKKKPTEINNLLAMCPRCQATYLLDNSAKRCKELAIVKSTLVTRHQGIVLLDEAPMEKGIVSVMRKLKNLKETDLSDAELDPKELTQKIKPGEDYPLYVTVRNYVSMYYVRLREMMVNLDKKGEIDYEEVQDQMKAIYRRLKKSKKTKMDVFTEIVAKLHRVSLQPEIYCQIVVAYFIQSCEVFDAVAE